MRVRIVRRGRQRTGEDGDGAVIRQIEIDGRSRGQLPDADKDVRVRVRSRGAAGRDGNRVNQQDTIVVEVQGDVGAGPSLQDWALEEGIGERRATRDRADLGAVAGRIDHADVDQAGIVVVEDFAISGRGDVRGRGAGGGVIDTEEAGGICRQSADRDDRAGGVGARGSARTKGVVRSGQRRGGCKSGHSESGGRSTSEQRDPPVCRLRIEIPCFFPRVRGMNLPRRP